MKIWFGWLIIVLVITGCAPVLPTLPPAPAETIIQHTPALRYIEKQIQACSLANSPLPVLVNEYPITRMNAQSADITLVYEKPVDPNLPAYQLGDDQLVVIVNPQNKVSSIPLDILHGIFQGFITHWDAVDPSITENISGAIEIWGYKQSDELQIIIENRLNEAKHLDTQINITDIPETIKDMVAINPASIGVITRAYLTDEVKVVKIDGLPEQDLLLPIVAQTRNQPGQYQTIILSCLQQPNK
jgi:hypothetical protein